MNKEAFFFDSSDGVTKIHAIAWRPEGEPKAVLQILHGMVEYVDRYDDFASYLADHGFLVVGHDHLGHGRSVRSEADYGYFQGAKGNEYVIHDIHHLYRQTRKQYPDLPYFMLGHSMGSFLLRQYLTLQKSGISGAIVMGTGYQPRAVLLAGRLLCKGIAAVKGWRYRSPLVNRLGLGSYNQKFADEGSPVAWLNSDPEKQKSYENDPLCQFIFTVNGYDQMFRGMRYLTDRKRLRSMDQDLPVLITSGEQDPVGNFGKGVTKVYEQFLTAGMRRVDRKLYPGDRHEILKEKDHRQVYEDIRNWMEAKM